MLNTVVIYDVQFYTPLCSLISTTILVRSIIFCPGMKTLLTDRPFYSIIGSEGDFDFDFDIMSDFYDRINVHITKDVAVRGLLDTRNNT